MTEACGYTEVCSTTLEIVLRHFINLESRKCRYEGHRSEMQRMLAAPFGEFMTWLNGFHHDHDCGNPVYEWVFRRNSRLRGWSYCRIHDLNQVFSSGINCKVNDALKSVNGNLIRLARVADHNPVLMEEFHDSATPDSEEDRAIIGVVTQCVGRDGSIELIDGVHRFVSIARTNADSIPAFLAQLHP